MLWHLYRAIPCLTTFLGLKPGQYSYLPDLQLGASSVVPEVAGFGEKSKSLVFYHTAVRTPTKTGKNMSLKI